MTRRTITTERQDYAPKSMRWRAAWGSLDEEQMGNASGHGEGPNEAAAIIDLVENYELPNLDEVS